MQLSAASSKALAPCRASTRSRPVVLHSAVETEVVTAAPSTTASETKAAEDQLVYLGFPKGDYAPREGRVGRFIKDDPSKYPDKEDIGFFKGVVGGWAGGEAALKAEIEAIKAPEVEPKAYPAPSKKDGAVPVYVGYGKEPEDFKARNSGVKGRVIYDAPWKYPSKEDVGFMAGATGGFAGGERGVKAFVRDGEVRIRRPGQPGGQGASPLTTAFLVMFAGVGAAAVSTQVYDPATSTLRMDVIEEFSHAEFLGVNILVGSATLAATAAGLALTRSVVNGVQRTVEDMGSNTVENAQKAALYGGFLVAVFFAARAVLEA